MENAINSNTCSLISPLSLINISLQKYVHALKDTKLHQIRNYTILRPRLRYISANSAIYTTPRQVYIFFWILCPRGAFENTKGLNFVVVISRNVNYFVVVPGEVNRFAPLQIWLNFGQHFMMYKDWTKSDTSFDRYRETGGYG